MYQVTIVADARADVDELPDQFVGIFDVQITSVQEALRAKPGAVTLFDIDLTKSAVLPRVGEWLRRKPLHAKAIFLIDKTSHLQQARAFSLGATDTLPRPLNGRELAAKLLGDVTSLSADPANDTIRQSPAVCGAIDSLRDIFSSACLGAELDTPSVKAASDQVVSTVEARGIAAWIETVRTHHSATYQHCLLVTGLAVAFGQQIGVSQADRRRLSFAGMLHDIGKARVPLAILEKPGRLTDDEMGVMKKHPQFGLDALETATGLPTEMLDIVIHHHEYLDGSGYPHGLSGGEICDLVRMVTIADVFGALIERRSYKPPLSAADAYAILIDMGPKLDKDLVRAFRPVTSLYPSHELCAVQ
jgi:putative nucleotidyltransferase with HDIG domain